MNSVDWNYFDKFDEVNDEYLPSYGEGETKVSQIVTAVNKLIYKWYNDGDVFDNIHSGMEGWCNDLSSYANWLYKYADGCDKILVKIRDCYNDDDYENLLKDLADFALDMDYLREYIDWDNSSEEELKYISKEGTIYNCDGPFEFSENPEDEDDDYWDEDEEDEYEEDDEDEEE